MTLFLYLLFPALLALSALGQGTIIFNNRLPSHLGGDQNIYLGGTERGRGNALNSLGLPGPGSDYNATLFLVGSGGSLTEVVTRPFRFNASGSANFFIDPVTAEVPGVPPGSPATFLIGVWPKIAGSYEEAVRANSEPGWWWWVNRFAIGDSGHIFVSQLGGLIPNTGQLPDPYLVGLEEFNVFWIPEPKPILLLVLGAWLLGSFNPLTKAPPKLGTAATTHNTFISKTWKNIVAPSADVTEHAPV